MGWESLRENREQFAIVNHQLKACIPTPILISSILIYFTTADLTSLPLQ
jgi:hypothetical protein